MLRNQRQVTLRCGNQVVELTTPVVMGIINVTPDSFYAPSRTGSSTEEAVAMASQMIAEGAVILDIGGMSSRPGAVEIPADEEIARICPVIRAIHDLHPGVVISADTCRARVAEEAIRCGAAMINDISGGQQDPAIRDVVAKHHAAYVLMHMRGVPADMQQHTDYTDLIGDLMAWFSERIRALRAKGIDDFVIDPGFGFAKTPEQNYELVARLETFRLFGYPVMIGVSRKSTLSRTIGRPAEETLHATTALHMAALLNGASVLRVHDVLPAVDAIAVYNRLANKACE